MIFDIVFEYLLYEILYDETVATLFSYYFFQAATTSDKFLPVCGGSARKKNKIYSCQLGHFRHRRGAFFNPKMYQKTRKKLETLKNWEKNFILKKILNPDPDTQNVSQYLHYGKWPKNLFNGQTIVIPESLLCLKVKSVLFQLFLLPSLSYEGRQQNSIDNHFSTSSEPLDELPNSR